MSRYELRKAIAPLMGYTVREFDKGGDWQVAHKHGWKLYYASESEAWSGLFKNWNDDPTKHLDVCVTLLNATGKQWSINHTFELRDAPMYSVAIDGMSTFPFDEDVCIACCRAILDYHEVKLESLS